MRKLLSFLLIAAIMSTVIVAMPITANAQITGEFYGEGSVYYSYEDGVLTLFGEGTVFGFNFNDASLQNEVKELVVGAGITFPDQLSVSSFFSYLEKITVDSSNAAYSSLDGVMYSKDQSVLISYPKHKKGASFVIPDSVREIKQRAFLESEYLTDVTISDGVEIIGESAFVSTKMSSFHIPRSVTKIGSYVFDFCYNLESFTVDERNTCFSSSDGILYNKDKSELIKYPREKSSTLFMIPDTVTAIGHRAFYMCQNLTYVEIPDSVQIIKTEAFSQCHNLSEAIIPDSVTEILGAAFANSEISDVKISSGVTKIDDACFNGCTELTSIVIPEKVSYIGESAFFGCNNLKEITMYDQITGVGQLAFYNSGLTDVYFYGSREDWNEIDIDNWGNEQLSINAQIHFMGSQRKAFDIRTDANSFWHNTGDPNSNAGFVGRTDHSLDKYYLEQLYLRAKDKREINKIKNYMTSSWNGSCYGITMTMGKLYNEDITLSDLTNRKVADYYSIGKPWKDKKFGNMIEYYHLSQDLSAGRGATIASTTHDKKYPKGTSSDIKPFLQKLVEVASQNKAYTLEFHFYIDNSGFIKHEAGHIILILNSKYYKSDDEYVVTLYDCNSVHKNQLYGSFTKMHIRGDFSSFTVEGSSDEWIENYTDMRIESLHNPFVDLNSKFSRSESIASSGAEDDRFCYLDIMTGTPFTLTDSQGRTLSYDGEEFSGDITIYQTDYLHADENGVTLELTLDKDVYTVCNVNSQFKVAFSDSDNYLSLDASEFETAQLSLDDGVTMSGKNYWFDAYLTTNEVINSYGETNMVRITGIAQDEVTLTPDESDVVICCEENINQVTVTNLIENQSYSEELGTVSDTVTVSRLLYDCGDADGDGIITVFDATFIQRYLASLSSLSDRGVIAADADADDAVTVLDATMIQRFLADLENHLGM